MIDRKAIHIVSVRAIWLGESLNEGKTHGVEAVTWNDIRLRATAHELRPVLGSRS